MRATYACRDDDLQSLMRSYNSNPKETKLIDLQKGATGLDSCAATDLVNSEQMHALTLPPNRQLQRSTHFLSVNIH